MRRAHAGVGRYRQGSQSSQSHLQEEEVGSCQLQMGRCQGQRGRSAPKTTREGEALPGWQVRIATSPPVPPPTSHPTSAWFHEPLPTPVSRSASRVSCLLGLCLARLGVSITSVLWVLRQPNRHPALSRKQDTHCVHERSRWGQRMRKSSRRRGEARPATPLPHSHRAVYSACLGM